MTDEIQTLKQLQDEIVKITKEIHQEFGAHCLILMEENPTLAKRLAIWSQTQILLVSTLKDGLCLPPLEFTTVKKLMRDFENSGMVLSEFSGSSQSFSGFHSFNSFVLQDLMQALDTSLSTPPEKKAEMMKLAYKYSSARSFKSWVENFLKDLKQAYSPEQTAQSRFVYLGLSTNAVYGNP
jgi:trehalose-6-phosphate synthase